jgi:hypothetical protein
VVPQNHGPGSVSGRGEQGYRIVATWQMVNVSLDEFGMFSAHSPAECVQKMTGNRSAPESPNWEYRYLRLLG